MTVVLKHHLSLCPESVEWLLTQPDAQTAWNTCDRPSWMLWVAEKAGVEKPAFVRIACEIARTVLHFVPEGEDRPRLAIEAAEAWLDNPNEENTMAADAYWAVRAANAAREAGAADAYWAVRAARAAADAARNAAYAASRAASWAAREASEASWAACAAYAARGAADAAFRASRAEADLNCADIIRKNIPFSVVSHLVETES